MTDLTFTHKELARRLGLSETTVKSYRRKFPDCFPLSSKGKPIRFTDEALRVAGRIQSLFQTGMSVAEVQKRLAAEFAWIGKEKEAADQPQKSGGKSPTPELSAGVNSMAKNLVALGLEQKTILKRIGNLEKLLEDLDAGKIAALSVKKAEAAQEHAQILEERLKRLDENTSRLSTGIGDLSERLELFIGRRDAAAAKRAEQSAAALAEAAEIAAEINSGQSRILAFNRNRQDPQPAPHTGAAIPGKSPSEPARPFLSLPLVARSEEGGYVSAGGRSRGRFSTNDLKAMLIYGFAPPHHFNLHWEAYGQGWRLSLRQDNGQRNIQLLLMEKQTQNGPPVAEILELKDAGAPMHPAEVCRLIDDLSTHSA
ncbi:MAG: helix-turn-helix domain-containing protein [Desulfovibrio sp.]|jgi:DNA-binding transcriptional MerR regulator|nr:helix-turn-helix domain-containing protein [Desulfovibrio sp.]